MIKKNNFSKIIIYPNPAKKSITIDLGENNSLLNASLEITDLLGKSIYNQTITKIITTINIKKLPKGIYLLKFMCGS